MNPSNHHREAPDRPAHRIFDIAVVGGGIAGLATAALAARAGMRTVLLERSRRLGGRAGTRREAGFAVNSGPHALYRHGAAETVLEDLGITASGRQPDLRSGWVLVGERLSRFPISASTLFLGRFLGVRAKLEVAGLLGRLARIEPSVAAGRPFGDWLDQTLTSPAARRWVAALARLSCYAHPPEALDGGAVLAQLQRGVRDGVRYLDGGWQGLVSALDAAAGAAGARIVAGSAVRSLVTTDDARRVRGLRLADGTEIEARQVVLALDPAQAGALLRAAGVAMPEAWPSADEAAVVAGLDVALSELPEPRRTFVLGVDQPLYLSVHSAWASLAPAGGAVVHVARCLAPGERPRRAALVDQLEGLLERVQPGWRSHLVRRWCYTGMVASHRLPRPGRSAVNPDGTGIDGLYVVGDWVGGDGMLADAALASARAAVRLVTASR